MASHVRHDRMGLPASARPAESSLPGWRSWLGAVLVVAALAIVLIALYR